MTRRRWRESIKTFGNHIDPEQDELLKGNKIETEDKVKKILKLVQGEDLEEKDGTKEPLVELIEGFHSQYQSLYAQYDNLRGELRKKIHDKKEKETYSSSSSDSGSGSGSGSDHSSKYKSSKKGELESEYQKTTDRMKQELDAAILVLEDSELKQKMTATCEEKEALTLEYQSTLSNIPEAEEIIRNLKLEAESLNTEKSKLTVENAELNQKLDAAGKIEAELNQEVSDLKRQWTATSEEKEALNSEYQTALVKIQAADEIIRNLKLEAESLNTDKLELSAENAELKQKLGISGELEAELNQRLEDMSRDKDNLIMEEETALRRVEEGEKIAEDFRKAEAKFLEEQRMLEERIATLSGIIVANKTAYQKMITDISEKVNSTFSELENVIQRLEDAHGNYEHSIFETSKELQIAKHLVAETNTEREQLKIEVSKLAGQLQNKKEQESILRGRVEELEFKASKEDAEKQNLSKATHQLEKKVEVLETTMKEKDEGILCLGEEKREAIRQLCVWIEYHHSRYNDLKEALSKKTVTGRRAT